MKEIALTHGKVALVDDADFDWLNSRSWHAKERHRKWYAYSSSSSRKCPGPRIQEAMHRVILGLKDSKIQADHIDGNGLNNQRSNLRVATQSQNQHNRGRECANTSGYKGVYFIKRSKIRPWQASIGIDGRLKYLGTYATKEEAARAYDQAARELIGDFAGLNFPTETAKPVTS